jgi:hypothetical protein
MSLLARSEGYRGAHIGAVYASTFQLSPLGSWWVIHLVPCLAPPGV